MRRRSLLTGATAALAGCSTGVPPVAGRGTPAAAPYLPADAALPAQPPPAPREFRAAWVASVANIDWPSRPGLGSAELRGETLAILDRARSIGLNAIVLQVRPAGDAVYASTLEPWSEHLGGAQGRGPSPPYDPLQFWLQEAHARGLELHAWFNPFRARHSAAKTPLVAPHLALTHPGTVKPYGPWLWMDPGEPAARERMLAVVADVLRRYEVDGIHIDDYFYPYPVARAGADLPFPDDASWGRYQRSGGALGRDDWRRANVNAMVRDLQHTVRRVRPEARLGISPFGIGRPGLRPRGIEGFSQYDKLFADVELWLDQGWCDYLAPQLYWRIDRAAQAFDVLLAYWAGRNRHGRHLWPGLYTSRVGAASDPWPASELIDQVEIVRRQRGAGGQLHYSMAALMQDRDGIATRLRQGPYAQPALVPATPWIDDRPPAAPRLRADGALVGIDPAPGKAAFVWAVWQRRAGQWRFSVQPAREASVAIGQGTELLAVSAVDRGGNESGRSVLRLA